MQNENNLSYRTQNILLCQQNWKHPNLYYRSQIILICQIELKTCYFVLCLFVNLLSSPHSYMSVAIPKLEFKIPEGRTYLSFNFPIGPNIVARKIWDVPHYLKNGWVRMKVYTNYSCKVFGFDISSQSNEEGFSNTGPQISKL